MSNTKYTNFFISSSRARYCRRTLRVRLGITRISTLVEGSPAWNKISVKKVDFFDQKSSFVKIAYLVRFFVS